MFGWLTNKVQNFRIFLDYPVYEKVCRTQHLASAELLYSTRELGTEIRSLENKITREADSRFDEKITDLNAKMLPHVKKRENASQILRQLTRSYDAELNTLRERKRRFISEKKCLIDNIKHVRAELRKDYDDKSEAYKRLNEAKGSVDSWHVKSQRTNWLGGNKGRKLPKHSFFGQSFGDLESAKNDRDKAGNDILCVKGDISRLKQKIEVLQNSIDKLDSKILLADGEILSVKAARFKMYQLKKEGITVVHLKKVISDETLHRDHCQGEIDSLKSDKINFLLTKGVRSGLVEMKRTVARILDEKKAFIRKFDDSSAQLVRRQEHRLNWLEQRR